MWSNPYFVFHPGKMGSGKTPFLHLFGEADASLNPRRNPGREA